jgi:hypothetical protein
MARSDSWRRVERDTWKIRLQNARDFMQSARESMQLADEGSSGDPIMSQACLAAIAYADALTIRYGGIKNAGDHGKIVAVVKQAMGNRADQGMLQLLARILSRKNQIQYAAHVSSHAEAQRYLEQVSKFREWAEAQLAEG